MLKKIVKANPRATKEKVKILRNSNLFNCVPTQLQAMEIKRVENTNWHNSTNAGTGK